MIISAFSPVFCFFADYAFLVVCNDLSIGMFELNDRTRLQIDPFFRTKVAETYKK